MSMFRKKVEGQCGYCLYATAATAESVSCAKKKRQMPADGHCRRFQYDPLKRIPAKPKALDFSKYEEYDFSL